MFLHFNSACIFLFPYKDGKGFIFSINMLVRFPKSIVTELVWWLAWESEFCLIINLSLSGLLTDGMGVIRGLLRSCTDHWCSLKSIEFLSCLSSCCLCAGFGRTGGMSVTVRKKQILCGNFLETFIVVFNRQPFKPFPVFALWICVMEVLLRFSLEYLTKYCSFVEWNFRVVWRPADSV